MLPMYIDYIMAPPELTAVLMVFKRVNRWLSI